MGDEEGVKGGGCEQGDECECQNMSGEMVGVR